MASVNKVIIVGNLGRDPEMKFTQNNTPVCNFTVATTDSWTDKGSGQKQERTEWHRVVAWGRLGEICGQYLRKGKQVYVEGRLQTRQWEDKDGNTRYTTEINCQTMQMLGRRGDDEGYAGPPADPSRPQQQQQAQGGDFPPPPQQGGVADEDDDLPF